jgi:hypothetical protein
MALRLCVSGLIKALQDVLRVCVCHEVSPQVIVARFDGCRTMLRKPL